MMSLDAASNVELLDPRTALGDLIGGLSVLQLNPKTPRSVTVVIRMMKNELLLRHWLSCLDAVFLSLACWEHRGFHSACTRPSKRPRTQHSVPISGHFCRVSDVHSPRTVSGDKWKKMCAQSKNTCRCPMSALGSWLTSPSGLQFMYLECCWRKQVRSTGLMSASCSRTDH